MITGLLPRRQRAVWRLAASVGLAALAQSALAIPVITREPQPLPLVSPGANVSFSVSASSPLPLGYQWRKNGLNIPNATNQALVITNVQPSDCGRYSVAVFDKEGAVNSKPALLTLNDQVPVYQFSDVFGQSPPITSSAFCLQGSNASATDFDPAEPNHGSKYSGRTVWARWVASVSGICEISTEGSAFDTIGGVYQGTLSALTVLATDNESGSYHNYKLRFNTVAGQVYHIAVAGFNAASGPIILCLNATATTDHVPRILAQPQDATLRKGASFDLFVQVASDPGFTPQYQWFKDEQLISGATGSKFSLTNVMEADVGRYRVRVNYGKEAVVSRAATIQIDTSVNPQDLNFFTADTLVEVADLGPRQPGPPPGPPIQGPFVRPPPPVSGFTGTRIFSTVGETKDENEPNHCGEVGGASEWFAYLALTNAVLHLNTDGSSFNTVLAVYTNNGAVVDYTTLGEVTCDNDSGTDGTDSRVRFRTTSNVTYYVAIDGVGGASGGVTLNYDLGDPPAITAQPTSQSVNQGTNVIFSVTANGTAPLTYQWQHAGTNLPGQTGSSLMVLNVQPVHAGAYTVSVTNKINFTNSAIVTLTVNKPPTLDPIGNPSAINEDAGLQIVNLTGIGAGAGESQPLTVTATSGNPGLIPDPTINYTSPNATGSLSYTPVGNASGGAVITVTVRDPGPDGTPGNADDTSASRMFTVTVNAVNDAPSFTNGPDQTVSQNAGPQTIAGWATSISAGPPNESGQTVDFNITGNTNPGLFSAGPAVNSSGTLTYTPAAGATGSAMITLVAQDNGSTANGGVDTSAPQTFTITVSAGNTPPAIAIQPRSHTVVQGNDGSVFVVAFGTPGPSYQWYFNSGIIGGATASSFTINNFQMANEGRYHVVVTNSAGAVTSQVAVLYVADPLRFVSNSIDGGYFQYRLVGRAGSNFVLEASSTLSSWAPLSTIPAPSGIVDGTVPVGGTTYFRARLLP